jgi:hypothetical protein
MTQKPTPRSSVAHRPLPVDDVGVDVRQRPVVAYRADQHERLARLHQRVHHAAGEHALLDRRPGSSRPGGSG